MLNVSNKLWENQFNAVLVDESKEYFGSNIEWKPKNAKKYISKLEALGAKNIVIKNSDDIEFNLPKNAKELLLFILNGGGVNGRMPSNVDYKKKTNILKLSFNY